ncbi:type I-E CRISPR-associated protein Cas7/Cse4/CasC [Desulfovibrio psychrotolerans]|uniref:Type I-E CRISPR-associated protein Cas7/Cse4/CasC n=1 Tax=Desulfovibrio psychrotolerans TaxID=415242 RepID=A0A7J0BW13_9BACT|nr:type I-E CRISPR-associated protein Cas7/Cse4/CasC [Desulfovibrio psychrotolerans]GFM37361.1 type I-E CRISPR-associated protein Cas7/Cse4/CasC [Desulfovibrio psychrotolerans]
MSKFIQLHVLTSYPASNLNRDDLGSPKRVVMGNTTRLRVSSQCLKRAWRTSDIFQNLGSEHMGVRTKEMGRHIFTALTKGCTLQDVLAGKAASGHAMLEEKEAVAIARTIAGVFGKNKSAYDPKKDVDTDDSRRKLLESLEIEQLAHFSQEEIAAISAQVEACRQNRKAPEEKQVNLLRTNIKAVDIAMFGRMLAAEKDYNMDAAVQVAHAMTVHAVTVADDFFTAVDDLNRDDSGAGHMGVSEFGAGVFYLYLCIDRDLLQQNLQDDAELTNRALTALLQAVAQVSPTGKQNSFGSHAYASYILAERGNEQPRNLSVAYLTGVNSKDDVLQDAITRLTDTRAHMNKAYGQKTECAELNILTGSGSLKDLAAFMVG